MAELTYIMLRNSGKMEKAKDFFSPIAKYTYNLKNIYNFFIHFPHDNVRPLYKIENCLFSSIIQAMLYVWNNMSEI